MWLYLEYFGECTWFYLNTDQMPIVSAITTTTTTTTTTNNNNNSNNTTTLYFIMYDVFHNLDKVVSRSVEHTDRFKPLS
jgi:hypothetical protein